MHLCFTSYKLHAIHLLPGAKSVTCDLPSSHTIKTSFTLSCRSHHRQRLLFPSTHPHRYFSSSPLYPSLSKALPLLSPTPRATIPAASTGGTSSSRKRNISSTQNTLVDPEVKAYWDQVLESIDKPTAKKLLQHIDTSVPLGVKLFQDSSTGTSSRSPSKPPVYSYFRETKLEHPTKVVLVRVGEFFEAVGIDAVLLVQLAGLNPMVRRCAIIFLIACD